MVDRLGGQGDGTGLVSLAGERDMSGVAQGEILQGQAGDLADPGGSVVEQDEEHPVPGGLCRLSAVRGEDGPCFWLAEIGDRCSGRGRRFESLCCLGERDEGDVFGRGVGQERFDGAEPQRDRFRRVVLLVGHPGKPPFQVGAVEVVETDLFELHMVGLGEIAEKTFQAGPVGLDRLGRQPSGLGHVGVEIVAGGAEEVRSARCRVASRSNPTSGNTGSLLRVSSA